MSHGHCGPALIPCYSGPMSGELSKAELRKQALARRALVTPEQRRTYAEHLAAEGLRLARARPGVKCVAAYWPLRDEADTFPLLRALSDAGFVTALPVVRAGKALQFRRWAPGDSLVKATFGLSEPEPTQEVMEPDVMFVPLAAFDRRGHRIGFGHGHFDATLEKARGSRPILAVGVAFSCQEIPLVPDEEHDQLLDFVITEDELLEFG